MRYHFLTNYHLKSDQTTKLSEELAGPLRILQETARRIAKVAKESKLEIDEEEYIASFRPELMDVVYAWCNVSVEREDHRNH